MIGGVISFTLVVAVGMRIAFSKVARRPRNRDIHMPRWELLLLLLPSLFVLSPPPFPRLTSLSCRSLVDILRHQSSPVQQGERNNAALLTTTSDGRMSKGLYTPILQSKDNRSKSAQQQQETAAETVTAVTRSDQSPTGGSRSRS